MHALVYLLDFSLWMPLQQSSNQTQHSVGQTDGNTTWALCTGILTLKIMYDFKESIALQNHRQRQDCASSTLQELAHLVRGLVSA